MDIVIGAIIFIVFVVISIAQKIKERAEIARAQRQRPQSKPGEMPAEARRNIYSEDAPVRVATPKGVPPREEPVAPARELMEALFYLKTAKHKGHLTLDMIPNRLEPCHACQIAIGNLSIFQKKLEKLDTSEMRRAQKTLDAVESQKIVRRIMLQG